MIQLLDKYKIKEITPYKQTDCIPRSEEKFWYEPLELLSHCTNKDAAEWSEYFHKVEDMTLYVHQLILLLQHILQGEKQLAEKDTEETKSFNVCGGRYSINEIRAINRITFGKECFSICRKASQYSSAEKRLLSYVDRKNKEIVSIAESPNPVNERGFNYTVVDPAEDDIYYDMPEKLSRWLDNSLYAYFICKQYFSNTGLSYFVTDKEKYDFIAGKRKGYIDDRDSIASYRALYDEKREYIENLLSEFDSEFTELEKSCRNCVYKIDELLASSLSINSVEAKSSVEADNKGDVVSKEEMFRELQQNVNFNAIKLIVLEFEEYCYWLIQGNYLTYENGILKNQPSFPKSAFYSITHDDKDFCLHAVFRSIHKSLCYLVGLDYETKKITDIGQFERTGNMTWENEIKPFLLKHIKVR